VALVSVVVLWITGAVQAWWTVGSIGELVDSDYGRVLGVKLVVVVATMGVATWNRRVLVPRIDPAADVTVDDRRRLGRTLRVEVLLLAVVVLVTSVLVETPPARSSAAGPQPFDQTLPVTDGVDLNLSVVPAVVGLNEIHLFFLDDSGLLVDRVESVTIEMSLPAQNVGPIVIGGALDSPGHYIARTENLVVAGLWRMEVVSRIGTFEQRRTTFDVPITP
jgi:copper transport protein